MAFSHLRSAFVPGALSVLAAACSSSPAGQTGVATTSDGGGLHGQADAAPSSEDGAAPGGASGDAKAPADAGTDGAGESIDAGAAPAHFPTLPIGAPLPTEAQCTAWVSAAPTPENIPGNATANHTTPTASWLTALHADPTSDCTSGPSCTDYANVTGAFTGSTDMILRWAACKWGIDEDIVRAEAMEESSWNQALEGDSDTTCHSLSVPTGAANYWTEASPCKPSKGILQEKMLYWNSWPYALSSTPLNADYRMAAERACMNGDIPWLVGMGSGGAYGTYPPTDTDTALYGCMGHWYSGSWGDSGAVSYVTTLKAIVASKGWPQ